MSKLIQLKVSDKKIERYNRIVDLLGLKGTFGEYQRSIEFGIDLAIWYLESQAKVLPNLEDDKLALFLSSIIKLKKATQKAELIKRIEQSNDLVLPLNP